MLQIHYNCDEFLLLVTCIGVTPELHFTTFIVIWGTLALHYSTLIVIMKLQITWLSQLKSCIIKHKYLTEFYYLTLGLYSPDDWYSPDTRQIFNWYSPDTRLILARYSWVILAIYYPDTGLILARYSPDTVMILALCEYWWRERVIQ